MQEPVTATVDILILGAGPAGLSTALHLARAYPALAKRVLVLEKSHHPRPKLCAGGLVIDAETILERLGLDVAEIPHADARETHFDFAGRGFRIRPGKKHALRIIRREEFDAWLAGKGARSGNRDSGRGDGQGGAGGGGAGGRGDGGGNLRGAGCRRRGRFERGHAALHPAAWSLQHRAGAGGDHARRASPIDEEIAEERGRTTLATTRRSSISCPSPPALRATPGISPRRSRADRRAAGVYTMPTFFRERTKRR